MSIRDWVQECQEAHPQKSVEPGLDLVARRFHPDFDWAYGRLLARHELEETGMDPVAAVFLAELLARAWLLGDRIGYQIVGSPQHPHRIAFGITMPAGPFQGPMGQTGQLLRLELRSRGMRRREGAPLLQPVFRLEKSTVSRLPGADADPVRIWRAPGAALLFVP